MNHVADFEKTALRVSPGAYFNLEGDVKDKAVFDYLLPELEKRDLVFLHIGIFDDADKLLNVVEFALILRIIIESG